MLIDTEEDFNENHATDFLLGKRLLQCQPSKASELPCLGSSKLLQPPDADDSETAEAAELLRSRQDLFTALSEVSSSQPDRLTHGDWLPEIGRVILTNEKDISSKIVQQMGYSVSGTRGLFLYSEEAVFLVESALLEVTYGGLPLSTQQCYQTLLSKSDITLREYLAYSHLVRMGYVLRRHDPDLRVSQYEHQIGLDRYLTRDKCTSHEASAHRSSPSHPPISDATEAPSPVIRVDLTSRQLVRFDANACPSAGCEPVETKETVLSLLCGESSQTTSLAVMDMLSSLFADQSSAPVADLNVGTSDVRISFDVYSPQSGFTKRRRLMPNYFLTVVTPNDPYPIFPFGAIVPLLLAVVDCSDVTFQCLRGEKISRLQLDFPV